MFRDKSVNKPRERRFSAWRAQTHRALTGKDISINRIISGLQRGLNKFCGATRVALVIAIKEDDELLMYDEDGLLQPHRQRLQEVYVSSSAWKEQRATEERREDVAVLPDLHLPGILSKGATSDSVFHQRWFVERLPNLAHEGPIYSWLEDAAFEMCIDFESGDKEWNNYTYAALADNALTAVVDYLYEAKEWLLENRGLKLPNPFPVVEAITHISVAREEGERASGKITFIDRGQLDHHLKYHMELDIAQHETGSLPSLMNTKHVRKLLTLCGSERSLLSDGEYILGIADLREPIPENSIVAEFKLGRGDIRIGSQLVCTFADGELFGDSGNANLSDVNRLLSQRPQEPHLRERLIRCVESILNSAKQERHGCTIIIDFHEPIERLPGEYLREPINSITNLDLVSAMSKIDGAIHLSPKAELIGFACLLDGKASPNEDRSRGARYNSGLRFSAKIGEEDTIVIVASEDGPISIFERGLDISSSAQNVQEYNDRVAVPLLEWLQF